MGLAEALDGTLQSLRDDVPDYEGAAVVDLTTGRLLAVDTVVPHPPEVLDVLASATAELFQGRAVVEIERMWKHRRGTRSPGHYFQEILVHSEEHVHLFLRCEGADDLAVAVVCRRTVNLGLLVAVARRIVQRMVAA